MKEKTLLLFVGLALFIELILVYSPRAYAFSLGDIVDQIGDVFSSFTPDQKQDDKPSLTVSSQISLAPDGDYNKNGQITSGDIITFTYTILNTTNTSHTGVFLKTNLDTKNINGISNIHGTSGIEESENTITVPNININKNQKLTISFDAQINFNKDSDQLLSTQPVLISKDSSILAENKDAKTSVKVNKMDIKTFNKFVHIEKNE